MMKSVFRALSIAALLVACNNAPPREPSGADVLARHVEWSGGSAALDALEDLTFEGKLTIASLSGDVRVQMTRAGVVRQEYDLGVGSGAEGVDASGGWRRNLSGQIESMPAADVARLRADIERAFNQQLRPEARAAAVYVARETIDGVECDRVRLPVESDGALVEHCIAADGALIATHTVRSDEDSWSRFSDWRDVRGVRFPFRQSSSGAQPQTVEWRRIETNTGLDPKSIARPASDANKEAAFTADVTLPLDLYLGSYLYVAGEINGTPTDVVIDSGAGITVVDRELADSIGLKGEREITASGVGAERRKVQLANGVRIRLGSMLLPPLTVAILDLSEVHERIGRRMPVILGKELFHSAPVTIDYAGRRVTVHARDGYTPPEGAVALPARPLAQGHSMIEARIDDLEPAWFMLDTGAGDSVVLHFPYVESNELLARYPRQGERIIGGVGGTLDAKTTVVRSFTIAGHQFESVPITLSTTAQGAFASTESAGTLGAEILSRFVVTFDYPRERVVFQPGPRIGEPFAKDRTGLTLTDEDDVVKVILVASSSPAAAAGFKKGETVVAIDGADLRGPALREKFRALRRAPVGTSVRFTMRDGAERTVKLADYF